MRVLTDNFLAAESSPARDSTVWRNAVLPADSLGGIWYASEYEALYSRLTAAVKSYMTSTQSSLAPRTEQMKKNAYRAVTPVLISVVVMIAIVLMLFYFVSIYCVDPVVRMNKALGDWIAYRMPFAVKADCKDEMEQLREKIESLTTRADRSEC